ncbi:MAG: KamA family radical SAM protein [Spirochaetales bacterium]
MIQNPVALRKITHWNIELRRLIRTREELKKRLYLYPEEERFFDLFQELPRSTSAPFVPLAIPPYYLNQVGKDSGDPIRLQCIPREEEGNVGSLETEDPLADQAYSPLPRLVHRYRDRVLLLVTDQCALHCRFCFRRHFVGQGKGVIRQSELDRIVAYLKAHPEVREVILSGGDPLTLSDDRFFALVDTLRFARPGIVLRVSSRLPVVLPFRITLRFVYNLRLRQPFWFVLHVNHPRELTEEADLALKRLAHAGIPLLAQTVLLRGVNDSVSTLEELFRALVARRVKPYYLFQADLAAGTSHFRVPLKQGLALMEQLRSRLSGVALPVYALDLPGGGGKVQLKELHPLEEREAYWVFYEGNKEYLYPKE